MRAIDLIEYFITYASYASIIVFSILLFKKKVPKSIKVNISKIENNKPYFPYRSSFEDEEEEILEEVKEPEKNEVKKPEENKAKVNDVKEKELSFREKLKNESAKYNKKYAEDFYKDHIEKAIINASQRGLNQIEEKHYFCDYPSLKTSYNELFKIIKSKGLDVKMNHWSSGVTYTISWE